MMKIEQLNKSGFKLNFRYTFKDHILKYKKLARITLNLSYNKNKV